MFSPLYVQRFKRVLVLLVGNQEIHFRNNVSVFFRQNCACSKTGETCSLPTRDVILSLE